MKIYEDLQKWLETQVFDAIDLAYETLSFKGLPLTEIISRELFYFMAEADHQWTVEAVLWHWENFSESQFNRDDESLLDCIKAYMASEQEQPTILF